MVNLLRFDTVDRNRTILKALRHIYVVCNLRFGDTGGHYSESVTLPADFESLLGADRVLREPLERHLYGIDAGVRRGDAGVIVFPETTAEVAAVVRLAAEDGLPVVARGAGTGLAGGAVPFDGAVVVSLTRMTEVEVDLEAATAWVGPGVINLDLTDLTSPSGYHFAPDPSSQSACTIGGNIATNSGGPHCLAEGSTVNHVLALEVVLGDGTIVTLGGPAPDPIGLDLRGVVVGSEGTLGIVTRALVKLIPNPPAVRTILLSFSTVEAAAATVSGIIARGIVPAALEMMDRAMTVAVERFVGAGFDTEAAAVLLVEVAGHAAAVEAEGRVVESVAHDHDAASVRIAADEAERELLWKGRKSAFGAVAQTAPDYYLHDTVVPRTKLVEVMRQVYEIADRYGLTMMNVFHAGDGNLHPLIPFDARDADTARKVTAAAEELVVVCVSAGGTLSGEHGIGLEKRDLMPLVFDEFDLDAQARIREAFDPDGCLNPGKILPAGSRCFDLGQPIPGGVCL